MKLELFIKALALLYYVLFSNVSAKIQPFFIRRKYFFHHLSQEAGQKAVLVLLLY